MRCNSCNKDHAGYRCPYCGSFALKDIDFHDKKAKSLYSEKRRRAEKKEKIHTFLFIFFVVLFIFAIFLGMWLETNI